MISIPRSLLLFFLNACVFLSATQASAQDELADEDASEDQSIEAVLIDRLAADPNDSASWRLLARVRFDQGRIENARWACEKAVELDPNSASGHYDMGRILLASHDELQAVRHFERAINISPESDYGVQAVSYLEQLGYSSRDPNVVPPSHDMAPNRFGGTTFQNTQVEEPRLFSVKVDSGLAYNSNIELAPINRDPSASGSASVQGYLAPQFQWNWIRHNNWIAGSSFKGYFTVNESAHTDFNLQDYQPGVFLEKQWERDADTLALRFQYDFTLNEFAGDQLGHRHAVTSSLLWDRVQTIAFLYWSVDYSNFSDDTAFPSFFSSDGWTHTIGGSYTWYPFWKLMTAVTGGVDVQLANLEGSDYAYNGVYSYVETGTEMPWDLWLTLQGGLGYRDYYDFVGAPSRNETMWRVGAELEKTLSSHWSCSLFSTYDRFISANDVYDSERFYSGLKWTYRW